MDAFINIVIMLANAVNMLVIIWFVLGLLFAFNVVNHSNSFLVSLYDSISRLFEPVLRPIRRLLPDTGAIDFAPMIMLLILYAIIQVLMSLR